MLRSNAIDELDNLLARQPLLSTSAADAASPASIQTNTVDTSHPFFSSHYGATDTANDALAAAEEGRSFYSSAPTKDGASHLVSTSDSKMTEAIALRNEIEKIIKILEDIENNYHLIIFEKSRPSNFFYCYIVSLCACLVGAITLLILASKTPKTVTPTADDINNYNQYAVAFGQMCAAIWPAHVPNAICHSNFTSLNNALDMNFTKSDAIAIQDGCDQIIGGMCSSASYIFLSGIGTAMLSLSFASVMICLGCSLGHCLKNLYSSYPSSPTYNDLPGAPDISIILPVLQKMNIDINHQPLREVIAELKSSIAAENPKVGNFREKLAELSSADIQNVIDDATNQEHNGNIRDLKREILNQAWNVNPAPAGKLYAFNLLKDGYRLFKPSLVSSDPTVVYGTGDSVINKIFDYVRGGALVLPARLPYVKPTAAEKVKNAMANATESLTSCAMSVMTCQRN